MTEKKKKSGSIIHEKTVGKEKQGKKGVKRGHTTLK